MPTIAARVEKPNQPFGSLVTRAPPSGLELVAERTTQAEIVKFSCATRRERDDMVKMKGCQRHLLQRLAILASVLRGLGDARAKFL